MKDSATRELARDYYIKNGFSIDTIIELLPHKVSRKTLYNWMNEENWEEARRRHLKKSIEIEERIYDILQTAMLKAQENPSPKNLLSLTRAFGLFKSMDAVRKEVDGSSREEEIRKGLSDKTVRLIEEKLGVSLDDEEE